MPDLHVYRDGPDVHVRVDRPGERAVSTRIDDVAAFLTQVADAAGLRITIEPATDAPSPTGTEAA